MDPRNTEVLERPFMCIRRMWIDGCISVELSPQLHTMNDDLYAVFISIGTAVVYGRHIAGNQLIIKVDTLEKQPDQVT